MRDDETDGRGPKIEAPEPPHNPPRNAATDRGPKYNLTATGIDLLNGPATGKRILFTGKSAKLGIKDDAVVAIRPSQHGYMASSANHYIVATLNGKRLTDKPEQLSDGDLIEFSELKVRFFIKPGE